jgi:predicted nucleic acid-binding protein
MRLALDSTFLAAMARGEAGALDLLEEWGNAKVELLTTEINYYETKLGIERLPDSSKRARERERFEKGLTVISVLSFDRAAAEVAVTRQLALFKRGQPAPTVDILVAATARSRACDAIVTRNARDFERIGLVKVRPH